MFQIQRDPTRTLLASLCIGGLAIAAFWIVRPFVAAAIWAVMIVVVTWPTMLRLQRRLWNRRGAAIAIMMVILLLLFIAPLTLAVLVITENAGEVIGLARSIANSPLPAPPEWLAGLPFVGAQIASAWIEARAAGFEGLGALIVPYTGGLTAWFVREAGSIGYLIIQFLLTLAFAAFLYAYGELFGAASIKFAHRLGGKEGEDLLHLAGNSIRGVALGVGLTAAIQSALGGIGLAVAGVPFAALLTGLLFMLCITQIGMLVVLLPAVVWVYWSGNPVAGTVLLVWSLFASVIDTFLRPILVRRSARLPLLLIFVGVIGGLVAFGAIGIFVGPVVLAVAYTLLVAWIEQSPRADVTATPDSLIEAGVRRD